MRSKFALLGAAALLCTSVMAEPPQQPQQEQPAAAPRPKIFIHAGLKTHAEGQHDYPQFLADWSKILTNRGALVDGALHFPSARELTDVNVLVIYKGDAGNMTADDRATLDAYLKRGGGVVSFHDALCGPDPDHFSKVVGGGKKHGEVNYTLEADVPYTIADGAHPIMQGMTAFTIKDEAFFKMTWARSPEVHVLATAVMAKTPSAGEHAGEVVPQIWTYENRLEPGAPPFRAFVWMQGHNYVNFSHPQIQPMLLRGIAWAAKFPADALATERPQGRGRRGRGN